MDDHTRLALEADIAHWNKMAYAVNSTKYATGAEISALCREFRHNMCEGCPVKDRTGLTQCKGTPRILAHEHWVKWRHWVSDEHANVTKAHQYMMKCQTEARNMECFLLELHPDNTDYVDETLPENLLDTMEQATDRAIHGQKVAVLVNFKRTSPLHRGMVMEFRERFPEHVTSRRYPNGVGFKSDGFLRIINAKGEDDWKTQTFDALYIHSRPDTMMPFELRELYDRIR